MPSVLGLISEGDVNIELREVSQTLPVLRVMDRSAIHVLCRVQNSNGIGVASVDFDPADAATFLGGTIGSAFASAATVAALLQPPMDYIILGIGLNDSAGGNNTTAAVAVTIPIADGGSIPAVALAQFEASPGGVNIGIPKMTHNRCPYYLDPTMGLRAGTSRVAVRLISQHVAGTTATWSIEILAGRPGTLPRILP